MNSFRDHAAARSWLAQTRAVRCTVLIRGVPHLWTVEMLWSFDGFQKMLIKRLERV